MNTCPYWQRILIEEPVTETRAQLLASHLLWTRCQHCIEKIESLLRDGGTAVTERWYDSPTYRYPYAKRALINRTAAIDRKLLRAIQIGRGVWNLVQRSG